MPQLTINLRNARGPIANALVKWSLTAPGPVPLFGAIDSSEILSDYTDATGELKINIDSSSELASQGANPPTWAFDITSVGLKADLVMPDEDCTLFDLFGGTAPSITNPIFRTATVWLDGEGAPAAQLGRDGDWYIDTLTGDAWKRAVGAWSLRLNLKGPPGEDGTPGDGSGPGPGASSGVLTLHLTGNRTLTSNEVTGTRLIMARGALATGANVIFPDVAFELRFVNNTPRPLTIKRTSGTTTKVLAAGRSRGFSYVP